MHKLEWLSKDDIIKRMVQNAFGRFLHYYANAPEIVQPQERKTSKGETQAKQARGGRQRERGPREAEPGFSRLFINLGKRDNFYAREIISIINRYVKGKVEVGRIDLTPNCSFFEVPEESAQLVMQKLARAKVGHRQVVVDYADAYADRPQSAQKGSGGRKNKRGDGANYRGDGLKSRPDSLKSRANSKKQRHSSKKEETMQSYDWHQFFDE